MAVRDILLYPERKDVLTTECDPVEEVDGDVQTLVDDLVETMYDASGIGLAAPQVGVTRRVTVVDLSAGEDPASDVHVLINPEIVDREGSLTREEGCLSFPGLYQEVERSAEVTVRATDRSGERFEIEAEDLLAVVFQHEIDHLDGILFLERMSALKRRMARKEYKKTRSRMEQ
ncbi:MAG: peptide deformylase [Bradymonadaceae bacterium]